MRLSWSWGAFFGTFAWLNYRKRRGWAWLYFFVSTPVLLVALIGYASVTDACERALGPQPGMVPMALAGLILLGWIVPPLVAGRIGDAPATGGYRGSLALQAVILIVAAVAAPSYANYTYRVRVAEGVSVAGSLRVPLAEYLEAFGRLPNHIDELAGGVSGKYVRSMGLGPDGTLRATFGGAAGLLAGRSVLMVPRIEGGKVVEWTCRGADLPDLCLPAACRGG